MNEAKVILIGLTTMIVGLLSGYVKMEIVGVGYFNKANISDSASCQSYTDSKFKDVGDEKSISFARCGYCK